jgi:hypothetical protein
VLLINNTKDNLKLVFKLSKGLYNFFSLIFSFYTILKVIYKIRLKLDKYKSFKKLYSKDNFISFISKPSISKNKGYIELN